MPIATKQGGKNDFEEREILYKFLFEMKSDLNDLKKMFYELVQRNNLVMPTERKPSYTESNINPLPTSANQYNFDPNNSEESYNDFDEGPVLINENEQFRAVEEIEESLSLDHKTKELITKALKKHKGRRKDAADELGISERTLYRKIKEYEIAI